VGFRFRKSVRIFPGLRLNLSRSGASVSLGAKGFHYTIGPKGTRVTAGIPGTGLSWTEYRPHTRSSEGRLSTPIANHHLEPVAESALADLPLTPIQSSSPDRINALSTSELAPILARTLRRVHFLPDAALLIRTGRSAAALRYRDLTISNHTTPDRRFNSNRRIPLFIFVNRNNIDGVRLSKSSYLVARTCIDSNL
jgi:Protein of unknown function (DUF4236)